MDELADEQTDGRTTFQTTGPNDVHNYRWMDGWTVYIYDIETTTTTTVVVELLAIIWWRCVVWRRLLLAIFVVGGSFGFDGH